MTKNDYILIAIALLYLACVGLLIALQILRKQLDIIISRMRKLPSLPPVPFTYDGPEAFNSKVDKFLATIAVREDLQDETFKRMNNDRSRSN